MSDIVERLRERAASGVNCLCGNPVCDEAAEEILRLRAENAKVRSLLRWNIVEDEEGLIICDGDHEKGEKCDHRRLYWQSTVDALRAENEKLRAEIDKLRDEYIAFMGQQIDKGRFATAAALKETGE